MPRTGIRQWHVIKSNVDLVLEAVEQAWGDLEAAESPDDVAHELKKNKYKHLRDRFTPQELWAEVRRRQSGIVDERRGIKQAELDTFLAVSESAGEDTPEKQDFFAHALWLDPERRGPMRHVSRVVLVHRLREVIVQLGFTRFEAAARDVDYELSLGVRTAPLAREVTWLPAVENRGEGIFIALDPVAIAKWRDRRPEVDVRRRQLEAGFDAWKKRRQAANARFPGVTYVMLHSLSHLLLTAVSLECGYAASSIRERIYLDGDRCGILLFTGTPDAEGTLMSGPRTREAYEAKFVRYFQGSQWPGARLPEVFHDPRTIEKHHISLHAKCIIIDDEIALVTSANTSSVAQEENIEAGVLIEDRVLVSALAKQYQKVPTQQLAHLRR